MDNTRLYHITAHWVENGKTYVRHFIISAENSEVACIIAHNRVPIKLTKDERPHPEDKVRLRVRDLGVPNKRRTYYSSDIITINGNSPDELSLKEEWAASFAIMWGYEVGMRAYDKNTPKDKLRTLVEYEDKPKLIYDWADEFLRSSMTDHEAFFRKKINELLDQSETKS